MSPDSSSRLVKRSFVSAHDMNICDPSGRHATATVHRSRHPIKPYLAAIALAMGLTMGLSLGGCGHEDSTAAKTTARYQGKQDTAPWDGSRWHGDRESWERAITARGQNQNEYVRIP